MDKMERQQRITDRLMGVIERMAAKSGRDAAAIRGLAIRVERLERLLDSYARIKGDGALIDRLGARENERIAEQKEVPPIWYSVVPFPELL